MNTLKERVMIAVAAAKEHGKSIAEIAKECGDISVQAVYQWADPQYPLNELKGNSLMGLAKLSGLNPWWINDGMGEKVLFFAKNKHQSVAARIPPPTCNGRR